MRQASLAPAAKRPRPQTEPRPSKPPQFELSLQAGQQGFVRRRTGDPLDQPLHRRLRRHLTQAASQSIDAVQLLWLEELLLSARSTRTDIDRGINALLRERPIELYLAVAGAFELLEDHIVYA